MAVIPKDTVKDIDRGMKRIERGIKKLDGASTNVGLFGNGGDPSNNIAARGAVHEYGSPSRNIVSRPFKRQAFSQNQRELADRIVLEYNKFLQRTGKGGSRIILFNIGEWYTGKEKIIFLRGRYFPLKAATITAKGSSKPLIDTGEMRRETTHREVMKR